MRAKTSQSHRRKVPEIGRSIEEVILTRKLHETNELSKLPQPASQPLTQLQPVGLSSQYFDQTQQTLLAQPSSAPNHYQSSSALTPYSGPLNEPGAFSGEDVKAMMDTLVHYCQALQVRVKELEGELSMQKMNNQVLPSLSGHSAPLSSTLAASASSPSFFKDQLNQHGLAPRSHAPKPQLELSSHLAPPSHSTQGHALDLSSSLDTHSTHSQLLYPSQNNIDEDHQIAKSFQNSSKIMKSIDKKLVNLSHIFSKNDPIARRLYAVTILQKNVRRFLVRCRYLSYKNSLKNWKLIRTSPVIWLIETINNIKNKKFYLIKNFSIKKKLNFMLIIFKKWKNIYINNKPWRIIIKKNVNHKLETKRLHTLSLFFKHFKFIVDKKKLNHIRINEKKALLETIRNSLIQKNKLKIAINSSRTSFLSDSREKQQQELSVTDKQTGLSNSTNDLITNNVIINAIITDDVIKKVYYNEVVVKHHAKLDLRRLGKFFNILKNFLIDQQNSNLQKAKNFFFQKFAGKNFFHWSEVTYYSNRELLNPNRWVGPRNYIIRYNQKRVDYFSRVRLERKVFRNWIIYTKLSAKVNLKYRIKMTKFLYENFMAWRNISKRYHELRVVVYDNWKNYSKVILRDPFNMWIDFIKASKTKYYEHSRIATAYRRWKWRQKMIKIIKVWRHQSIFGRTDGLYSRQMLLKSLSESKHFIYDLEKLLNEQTLNLDECKAIIQNEVNNKNALQENIIENNLEIESLKLQNHNMKQELLRMNSMMESLKVINPKQFNHLDQLQFTNFEFKERLVNYEEIQAETTPIETANMANIQLAESMGENILNTDNCDTSSVASITSASAANSEIKPFDPRNSISNTSNVSLLADPNGVEKEGENQSLVSGNEVSGNGEVVDDNVQVDYGQTPRKKIKSFEEKFEEAKAALSVDDLKILERAKWIILRYQEAMEQIMEQDEEKSNNQSLEEMKLIQAASQVFESSSKSQLTISPLTGSPIRTRSRSNSSFDLSPNRKSSLTRSSGGLLRKSVSMDEANLPNQSHNVIAIQGLEDTVISWAKMLESFLEFITYGEISLLPSSDKRHWARFLIDHSAVPLNDIPPEVLTASGQVDNSLSRSSFSHDPDAPPDMMKEIQKALVTVDQLMHGGKSWKEALMNLRVMFPGPGNFTGHTIKDESDVDTNLFRRFLKMSKDIQSMEEQQSLRFNKPNMESQRGTPIESSPYLRGRKFYANSNDNNDPKVEFTPTEERNRSFNIYSSNLSNSLKNLQKNDPMLESVTPVTYVPLRLSRQSNQVETGPPPLSTSSTGASLYKTLGLDEDKRRREEEELEAIQKQEEELKKSNTANSDQSQPQSQPQPQDYLIPDVLNDNNFEL